MIKDNFKITESASYKIQKLLLDENSSFFRVSVDGGGCSGFQYKFVVENSKNNDDLEFKQFGVKVIVDELSIQFLNNCELDYVEELVGSYFKVNNQNAKESCGCGTSFSL